MKALIVADGDVPARSDVDHLLGSEPPNLVVAADGGAMKALALGFKPNLVVGDADSLGAAPTQQLRDQGVEVIIHPAAKDESDTELAVAEAVKRGATSLVVVGAFGGPRLEHTVANLFLLAMPGLRDVDARLADAATEVRLVDEGGAVTVDGQPGDFVSLFPLAPVVEGVTTSGLAYPLVDESLTQGPARGLSNKMTGNRATISARSGRLLVIHTRL